MSTDDLFREIMFNRVILLFLLFGGGLMFCFVGIMAFLSVRMVRTPLHRLNLVMDAILRDILDRRAKDASQQDTLPESPARHSARKNP